MSNGGATIDELVTFKYKKKFSFAKKNHSLLSTDEATSGQEKSVSSSEDSDLDELREKNLNWKGSAKLKAPGAANKSSSEDETDTKKKKHKKSSKKQKKESHNEEKLKKLYRMFPHHKVKTVQMAFAKHDQNAKKCAEYLLKEKENGGVRAENDVEIEEWSDGDEGIRARNAQARSERKASEEMSDSSENVRKRKVSEGKLRKE